MLDEILTAIAIGCILLTTVYRSKFKGDIGELVVAKFLKNLDKSKYKVIHDIKLNNPTSHTKTSQIDHLVVSKYGILLLKPRPIRERFMGKNILVIGLNI